MRPQNVRNADKASQGKVARKRYNGTPHADHVARLGQGWTTGHQNRMPAAKKHVYSTSCQRADLMPTSKSAGVCHASTVATPANQQNSGCVTRRPNVCTGGKRNNGPETRRSNGFAKPFSRTITGAPSRVSGALTVMRMR